MGVSGANQAVWRTGGGWIGSREQIWRFGAREGAFRALRAPLYATRGVASEECECRKIGSPTEVAAGQPKERQGDRRSGREAPKGVCGQRRGLGALGLK